MFWQPFPFVRYVLALMVGIGLGSAFPAPMLAMGLAGLATLGLWLTRRSGRTPAWLRGGLLGVALMALGASVAAWRDPRRDSTHLVHYQDTLTHYVGTLVEVRLRPGRTDAVLRLERVRTPDDWQLATGRVLLRLPPHDSVRTLRYGTRLLVVGQPTPPAPPRNPGEFDYQQYLAHQRIYHRHRPFSYRVVGYAPPSRLWATADDVRRYAVGTFRTYVRDPAAFGIASALVLGARDDLDPATRQDYTVAGATHILAVSGLHVGILYFLVATLLGRHPQRRGLRLVVLLVVLWGYALVTGLSPSVQRATAMFTVVAIAQALGRPTQIYNTLALSAFVLLLVNPNLLFSVGFQLSYAAVLGIVYLQPRLASWWQPPHRVVRWVWELTCVSLAAQLATTPLSLYYFHAFPVYFWLSNLVAIPGAFLVLSGGLLLLLVGLWPLPELMTVLGLVYTGLVRTLNGAIHAVAHLPGATSGQSFYLAAPEALTLYAGVAAILVCTHYRQRTWLVVATVLLVGWGAYRTYAYWQGGRAARLVVYSLPRHAPVGVQAGHQLHLLTDTVLIAQPARAQFAVGNSLVHWALTPHWYGGDRQPAWVWTPWPGCRAFVWRGQQVVLLDAPLPAQPPAAPLVAQLLVVRDGTPATAQRAKQFFRPDRVVLTTALNPSQVRRWQAQARAYAWPCYDVNTQGAFVWQRTE